MRVPYAGIPAAQGERRSASAAVVKSCRRKPAPIGKCCRRTTAIAWAYRRSFANRDARPRDLFGRDFPAWVCNVPNSCTTHRRIHPRTPTRGRNVWHRRGSRVPNLGENREGIVLRFGELPENGCLQRRRAASAIFAISLPEDRIGRTRAARIESPSLALDRR